MDEISKLIDDKGRLNEYRYMSMLYEGKVHYHIERRLNGGKWRLLFGGLSLAEAILYLKAPELIESKRKYYRASEIFILILTIICGIIIWLAH